MTATHCPHGIPIAEGVVCADCQNGEDSNGWKPIDSAPMDGTIVLLWGRYCCNICACEWHPRHKEWRIVTDGSTAIEYQSSSGTEYSTFDVPSHWMTMPEPPKLASEQ